MDALSRTLARIQQMNMMRQQFSENSGKFFSMKPGILPNSGVGLPSGGASLRSTGVSFPRNNNNKKTLPPAIEAAIEDDSNDEDVATPQPSSEDTSTFLSPKVKAAVERSAK